MAVDICDNCSCADEEMEYEDCFDCGRHFCLDCLDPDIHDCSDLEEED